MTTFDTRYAVYVADECLARFVHDPDAAHYRQQLIRRVRDGAPNLSAARVAAAVSVRDEAPAASLPLRVWLLWDSQQLISIHATPNGADAARRERLERHYVDHLATPDADAAVTITTAAIHATPDTAASVRL